MHQQEERQGTLPGQQQQEVAAPLQQDVERRHCMRKGTCRITAHCLDVKPHLYS